MLLRNTIRLVLYLLIRLLTRLHVIDLDKVPLSGKYIIAANHLAMIDAPLVFCLVRRNDLTALVADKYRKNAFFRSLVDGTKTIWLHREDADPKALRSALEYMKAGGGLGIAPEGTRSPTKALIQPKSGVAYLADKAQAPIIPVAIWGSEQFAASIKRLHRQDVYIRFGEMFTLPPVERRTRDQDLQRNTDEIMCRIAAMLPEQYHGVYAEHPRLKELQSPPEA